MGNEYIFIVTYVCVPDHYNVYATTNPKSAVSKYLKDKYFNIEIWMNDTQVGEYGNRISHDHTDFELVYNEVLKMIEEFESR